MSVGELEKEQELEDPVEDRKPEADDAPSDDTPPEPEDSGEEPEEPDSEPPGGDSETPPAPEPEPATPEPKWITDDHRDLAASYGMSVAELSDFESPRAFQQACRTIDRHLAGRAEPSSQPEGEKLRKPAAPSTPTPETPAKDNLLDLAQYEVYDEETKQLAKVARQLQEENQKFHEQSKQFQKTMDSFQKERAMEAARNDLERFHETVDGMDRNLFGGDQPLTKETDGRRAKLWDAFHTVREHALMAAKRDGRPPKLPPMKTLLHRAAMFAFGEEMMASERKANVRAVGEQAKRRRPVPGKGKVLSGAAPKGKDPQTVQEATTEIVNSADFQTLWQKLHEDAGNPAQ